jgi:hypothetical protein
LHISTIQFVGYACIIMSIFLFFIAAPENPIPNSGDETREILYEKTLSWRAGTGFFIFPNRMFQI